MSPVPSVPSVNDALNEPDFEQRDETHVSDQNSVLDQIGAIELEQATPGKGATENDFSTQDFHPNEARPPPIFSYCVHFENIRHSLNIMLKKPIKKPFATNSKKIVIQAQ